MPPLRLWAFLKPCSRSHFATRRLLIPWWQCTTRRFCFQGSSSSSLSGISCIGMSLDWAILAIEYSSSVRQSSKRQSSLFDVSNRVDASLGIISVGSVMFGNLSKYGSSRIVRTVNCSLNVSTMAKTYWKVKFQECQPATLILVLPVRLPSRL